MNLLQAFELGMAAGMVIMLAMFAILRWPRKKKEDWLWPQMTFYTNSKRRYVNYPQGILFDDEEQNREKWTGKAFDEKEITEILKKIKKTVDNIIGM